MIHTLKHDRTGSPRIDESASTAPLPLTESRRFSPSAARALYDRELAFYIADAPFLTVEKCAERCAKLSMLLTQAQVG